MKNKVKIWSFLLMIVLVSSYAVALEEPVLQQEVQQEVQQADTSTQLEISGSDVITASDAAGGAISSRDLLLIAAIGVVILVIAVVL
ncbi:MAG: hypothetical protein JXA62_06180 [Candidatus Aminicenantes bacterium]|nr:hypothetical protein [Candidatus Aminicenantes bacterium]